MNEHAGIHIPVGVDMKIPSSAGDTPSHILAVILKIHSEDSLFSAEFSDLMIHELPLFWTRKKSVEASLPTGM